MQGVLLEGWKLSERLDAEVEGTLEDLDRLMS
jgi:hypothetical protein